MNSEAVLVSSSEAVVVANLEDAVFANLEAATSEPCSSKAAAGGRGGRFSQAEEAHFPKEVSAPKW